MLILNTYNPAFGEPTASPFCTKAMCMLEMSGQEWKPKFSNDPRTGPKSKLPVLIDGDEIIPDSDVIRTHLETKYNADFDKGLSDEQKAVSRAVIRMVEEHLYFALVCNRWLNDENWAEVKKIFFGGIPRLINGFVTKKIRASVQVGMNAQGMGRHSVAEQFTRANLDINAIQTLLGDKPFLFGDNPTAADMSVVPMLRGVIASPAKTALRDRVKEDAGLMVYLDRGKAALYPK